MRLAKSHSRRSTRGGDAIRALCSGYASPNRESKPLVFLQAISDDSQSQKGGRWLHMAGYVNHANDWALFADAWAEQLADAPAIKYLKMVEAQNLRGEFRHWTPEDRDKKLRSLARVIRHFKPVSFDVSINVDEYEKLVAPYAPYGLATPYFPCLFAVVSAVTRGIDDSGPKLPIDFIFDNQDGVQSDFHKYFDYMIRNLPRNARDLINGSPIFRDDKLYPPLQAADMLVWHVRRENENGREFLRSEMSNYIAGCLHISMPLHRDSLELWGSEFQKIKGIELLQTKNHWKRFRKETDILLSSGYILPYGTRWKNFINRVRKIVGRDPIRK